MTNNPYAIIPHERYREKTRKAKETHLNLFQVV